MTVERILSSMFMVSTLGLQLPLELPSTMILGDSYMKPSEFINLIDYNKHWMNIKGDSVLN